MILSPLGPFLRLQNNLERRKREEGRNTEEFLSIFQYPPKDINRVCSYNLWMINLSFFLEFENHDLDLD